MTGIYEEDLDRRGANFSALSPLSFFRRTRDIFPDRLAVIDGDRKYTWQQTDERCVRVADALSKRGIERSQLWVNGRSREWQIRRW